MYKCIIKSPKNDVNNQHIRVIISIFGWEESFEESHDQHLMNTAGGTTAGVAGHKPCQAGDSTSRLCLIKIPPGVPHVLTNFSIAEGIYI